MTMPVHGAIHCKYRCLHATCTTTKKTTAKAAPTSNEARAAQSMLSKPSAIYNWGRRSGKTCCTAPKLPTRQHVGVHRGDGGDKPEVAQFVGSGCR